MIRMAKMIQIRNVPNEVHRELKVRAARAGMTLSEFLLREVRHIAGRPEMRDLLKRIRGRRPYARLSETPAEVIRAERESRS